MSEAMIAAGGLEHLRCAIELSLRAVFLTAAPLSAAAVVFSLILLEQRADAEDFVVKIDDGTFKPAEVIVAPAATVTFENVDSISYAIVVEAGQFHALILDPGEKFTVTLSRAKEIIYFFGLHPNMNGQAVVAA